MKIYKNPNLDQKHCNGVIAIGNFDGLHLGHQKVIQEAKQKAKDERPILVISKRDRQPIKATLLLEDLLKLINEV